MNEFESDWISLSQSQSEVRLFWVNLKEDNKVSESKMTVSQSNMAEFKMAAIIKLSQNEWVKCFMQMVGTNLGKCEWVWEEILRWLNHRLAEFKMAEFKMAAIIKLSENEWVWVRLN